MNVPAWVHGATRVHWMIGHPIAQVRMPALANEAFSRGGLSQVLVPLDIPPQALHDALCVYAAASNVHGLVCTLPHKMALAAGVDRLLPRAALLGAANVVRKSAAGLEGDMLDGVGFGGALAAAGRSVQDRHVGIIGCGGFGRAAALEALERGASTLSLLDANASRAESLSALLCGHFGAGRATACHALPSTVEVVVNASPLGMRGSVGMPCRLDGLRNLIGVVDAVTGPRTPLVAEAMRADVWTVEGDAIAQAQLHAILEFWAVHPSAHQQDQQETQ